jgi:hypothetical protein
MPEVELDAVGTARISETGDAPSSKALRTALNVIEAKATLDGPERLAHIRVGSLNDRPYLDLRGETRHAGEIDATAWRVTESPPVRFRRAPDMKPIPIPVRGGSIPTLHSFLNVQAEADFVLVVVGALASLSESRSHAVM